MNIYFYTIKPILPNQELLVWYCREFAERLSYPLTGELMLQRIRKGQQHIVVCMQSVHEELLSCGIVKIHSVSQEKLKFIFNIEVSVK
jgi:hypothetical protein